MSTKTAYFVRKIAWVTLTNQGVSNVNLGWGDADFIVHKGAFSNLEFIVRDVDRKSVNLSGRRVYATLINNNTQELYLERELEVLDYEKGRCKLVLTPGDIINWESGAIRYSLTFQNIDTNEHVYLYNDLNQEAIGYIELRDRAAPKPNKTTVLDNFTPVESNRNDPTVYYAGAIMGPGQMSYTNALMTFAAYFDNFTGTLFVEATLDPVTLDSNANWFKLELVPFKNEISYKNKSGIDAYNISGEYQWIRFGYFQNIGEEGSLTKILVN